MVGDIDWTAVQQSKSCWRIRATAYVAAVRPETSYLKSPSFNDYGRDHKWHRKKKRMLTDPLSVKVAALLMLAALRLFAGLSPLLFANCLKSWGERQIEACSSLALCFGGGILLASCMLHMIPEVRESLTILDLDTDYPLSEFIICCGFFLVYIVEETIQIFTKPTGLRSLEAEVRINGKVTPIDQAKGFGLTKKEIQGGSRHFLVLVALSLHSALEGLALGLQTNPKSVWMLFFAIGAHATTVLFSIGLDLVAAQTPDFQIVIFMAILALSSPLGGLVGILATAGGEKAHAGIVVILQGIAAGAVLYVTFFEVLEKEKKKGGFLRLAFVLLGFAVMASFQLLGTHNHLKESLTTGRKEKVASSNLTQ